MASNNFVVSSAGEIDLLMVGGGGAGGHGGGGAGGMRVFRALQIPAGTYSVTIGAGGAGSSGADANTTSIIQTAGSGWTDLNTGIAGGGRTATGVALNGGGGGGFGNNDTGAAPTPSPEGTAIAGTTVGTDGDQNGFYAGPGGSGTGSGFTKGGGGGGAGSGGAQMNGTSDSSITPNGGAGLVNTFRTGEDVTYAGGGGGGTNKGNAGAGGSGGGGAGGLNADGTDAEANTGGGGGGAFIAGFDQGNGGSGIVVIRYTNQ